MATYYVKCANPRCGTFGSVGDPFLVNAQTFPIGRVPEGWYLILHRSETPHALGDAPEDPFCSLNCVQSWAATAAPRREVTHEDIPF